LSENHTQQLKALFRQIDKTKDALAAQIREYLLFLGEHHD